MEVYYVNLVVLAVISWTAAFLSIRKIFPKLSFEFCNRLVSTIHATLAVTLASLSVQDWSCPLCPLASKSSPRQVLRFDLVLFFQTINISEISNLECNNSTVMYAVNIIMNFNGGIENLADASIGCESWLSNI